MPLDHEQPSQKSSLRIIRQLQESNERNKSLANQDKLTGLYNQNYWLTEVERYSQNRNPFIVAFLDLDNLKKANDIDKTHQLGDQLLINTANSLRETFRDSDILARIGGDEFGILIEVTNQDADKEILINKLNNRLKEIQDDSNFSFGVSYADSGHELSESIKEADQLMYQNKHNRKEIKILEK